MKTALAQQALSQEERKRSMKIAHTLIKARGMILAAFAALACALALAPGVAMADEPTYDRAAVNLAAQMTLPQGSGSDGEQRGVSVIKFKSDKVNGVEPSPSDKMPGIGEQRINFGPDVGTEEKFSYSSIANGKVTYTKVLAGDKFIPDANSFPYPGVFEYQVYQSAYEIYKGSPYSAPISKSEAEYLMRVYVINDGAGGLTINGVTVEKTKDDASAASSAGKVDPAKGSEAAPAKFSFANSVDPKTSLKIHKAVVGDYGDLKKQFTFKVTVDTHIQNDTTTYVGTYGRDGQSASSGSKDFTSGNEFEIELTDGQYFLIQNSLPIGTTYTITEVGTPGYSGEVEALTSAYDAAGNPIISSGVRKGSEGANIAAAWAKDGDAFVLGLDNDDHTANTVNFTNTYKSVSPTGIFVDNLPYVLMVGIPLGCAALYLVAKRRKNARAAR